MKNKPAKDFLLKLGLLPIVSKAKWPIGFQICTYLNDKEVDTADSIPNVRLLLKAKCAELRINALAIIGALEKRIDAAEDNTTN